jgi:glycosyltransferase involved in cell wall biosynthesis
MILSAKTSGAVGSTGQKSPDRVNLHLYTSALRNDSRFLKQARSILRAGLADDVVLVGQSKCSEPAEEEMDKGIRLVRFKTRLATLPKFKPFGFLKYGEFVCRQALMVRDLRPTIIQCHSVSSLPAAVLAASIARLPMVYDARELETESNELRGINQALARFLERSLIRYCDAVLCVSESIAEWYAREYGIPRPFIVRNIPDVRMQTVATSEVLRERFRIPRDELIFVYAGALISGRRIQQMIRVFQTVPRDRHLVLMGFGPLEDLVKAASAMRSNIHFLPAVPPTEVLAHLAGANVAIVGVENSCLSYHLSLPNKIFEYLLSGIPFLAPDYPEMRRVLDAHECGWVVGETDDHWRKAIEEIDQEKVLRKRERVLAARMSFSWENEEGRLLEAYRQAAGKARFSSPKSGNRDGKSSVSQYPLLKRDSL